MTDTPRPLTTLPMSESTPTDPDRGDADSLDVEALFATEDTDVSIEDEESPDDRPDTPGSDASGAAAEDTTAGELFSQLREEHATEEPAAGAVTEESPEDIVAKADRDATHVDAVDDAISADADALDDLLLTGRRAADGFLWVDTDDEAGGETGATAEGDDGSTAADASADDDAEPSAAATDSFEERALTFDDADALDGESESGTASDDDTASEPAGGDGTSSDGDGGGLADRIRSMLSR